MGRLIRLDWAIKNILREKANFEILEGFLSELLGFDLTISEILESESNKDQTDVKMNRVDILVRDQQGALILVEFQTEVEIDFLQRILFGSSVLVTNHLKKGDPYGQVRKIYTVSIVYFNLGVGEDYIYHGRTSFEGLRRKDQLKLNDKQKAAFKVSNPEELFPEHYLIKVPQYDNTIRDTLDEWIYFLKNEEIKQGFKAKGIQSAYEKLEVLKLPEVEQQRYRRYLYDLHYQASMVFSAWDAPLAQGQSEVLIRMIHASEDLLGLEREDDAVLEKLYVDQLNEKARALWNRVEEVKVQSLKKAEQAQQKAEQAEQKAEQEQQAREQAEQKAEQEQQAREQAEQKAEEAKQQADQAMQQADQAMQQADQAKQQADQAKQQADQAKQQAEQERAIRLQLEQELAALKAKLTP